MNDDKDGCMAYVILTAIGLFAFMIFLANGGSNISSSSSGSTGSTYGRPWKKKLQEYEKQKAEKEKQNLFHQQLMQNAQRYQNLKESQPVLKRSTRPSPDDAYSEGYDEGYDQGRIDGVNGHMHGYGYDDSSSYYNRYETRYREGYEEGYGDGYSSGQTEYDEAQED